MSLQIPISLHKSENNVSGSCLPMRAMTPSLQISTPTAVLRFDSVVGRKPATAPLFNFVMNNNIAITSLTNAMLLQTMYHFTPKAKVSPC